MPSWRPLLLLGVALLMLFYRSGHPSDPAPPLHVQGNHLVTDAGRVVRLLGVDRSGAESACVATKASIFGYHTDQASIDAIASWHANAVRIPLNEDCWLGINGLNHTISGTAYRAAVTDYVTRLVQTGLWVIVDLHWSAPGTQVAKGQQQMPDADHAPAFWRSVAHTFRSNRAVLFDLYNEPIPLNMSGEDGPAWVCLRDGTGCNLPYRPAGMQSLVNAVRSTGAMNVIMAAGTQWAGSLTHWLRYRPHDPTGNLAASWHSYTVSVCKTVACYETMIAPVAAQVPVIAGEIGDYDCSARYVDQVASWLDAHSQSYLAWVFSPLNAHGACGPFLTSDDAGTPQGAYGRGYRAHLLAANP